MAADKEAFGVSRVHNKLIASNIFFVSSRNLAIVLPFNAFVSCGVFSQRRMNEFCGYFAELVDCNVHLKNEFNFVEFFNGNTSKLSCWLVGILGVYVHCITI